MQTHPHARAAATPAAVHTPRCTCKSGTADAWVCAHICVWVLTPQHTHAHAHIHTHIHTHTHTQRHTHTHTHTTPQRNAHSHALTRAETLPQCRGRLTALCCASSPPRRSCAAAALRKPKPSPHCPANVSTAQLVAPGCRKPEARGTCQRTAPSRSATANSRYCAPGHPQRSVPNTVPSPEGLRAGFTGRGLHSRGLPNVLTQCFVESSGGHEVYACRLSCCARDQCFWRV
jgi:hypothetical protein